MSEASAAQKDRLMNDLKLVISDAEELLRMTADQAGEAAGEVRKRVQERLADAKEDLKQLQDIAISKAKAAGDAADHYVHENPWKSIGIAAGVGLVVGLLISRR